MPSNHHRLQLAHHALLLQGVAGAVVLGAVALWVAEYVAPQRIRPWLGVCVGLLLLVLAAYLFLCAWAASQADDLRVLHQHDGHGGHTHWTVWRGKGGGREIGRGTLVALGLALLAGGVALVFYALRASGFSFSLASLTALRGNRLGSFVGVVALGLFLGMRHSTDPDHVVAVSTIVSRERSVQQGALIGMMWGLGHTVTIFIVGAGIILFNLTIPPRVGLSMEMAVAAMLILLGVLNLTGVMQRVTERLTPAAWTRSGGGLGEPPTHCKSAMSGAPGDVSDEHSAQRAGKARGLVTRYGYYQLLRPLAIGLVHGLAGSAAVALLVLSMIHSTAWAIAYLVVFGLGTVIGMMLMTTVMAIPIALTGRKSTRYLTIASGVVSLCFGVFLVYHLGFVDGLFTSHAHWTPE